MKLYNTLSRKMDEFIPHDKNRVTMYTCGPTVYHYAHIGNLRSYIMEDVLEKTLNYIGYNVDRVMNITDVGHLSSDADTGDDKMVKGAIREKKTVLEIAKFYTNAFFDDCRKLNIKKPDTVVPATSMIAYYIKMIEGLISKGYAYHSGGNIYFDTSKLSSYYVLSNHNEKDLAIAVRDDVSEDNNKKNKTDFVLWFTKSKFQDQELKWDSPWGLGYPGWHIECSCISLKYLGEYLDIHCGGVDNIFPHHTNEIAQTESYIGHKWCNYWFHVEHLNNSLGKMSKSSGDFLTVNSLEKKGYNPLSYRLLCLQSHYRKQLLFSYDVLDGASGTYNKLKNKIKKLVPGNNIDNNKVEYYKNEFINALSNDLNTSMAITVLYDVLKDNDMNDDTKLYLINDFDKVLSLDLCVFDEELKDDELACYIQNKIEERNLAKQNKDYAKADKIRDELKDKNVIIRDTRDGTVYEIIR